MTKQSPYDDEPNQEDIKTDITEIENLSLLHEEYEHGLDVENGIFYLVGSITDDSVYEFIGGIRLILKYRELTNRNKNKPITIFIHSYGGDLYAGLAIIDYINSLSVKVDTITRGIAFSCAGLILISGTGERYMGKNSFLMFHEISSDSIDMKASNIKSNSDHLRSLQELIESFLEKKSNKDKKYWNAKISNDYFVGATEALEYQLITKII